MYYSCNVLKTKHFSQCSSKSVLCILNFKIVNKKLIKRVIIIHIILYQYLQELTKNCLIIYLLKNLIIRITKIT